MNNDLISRDALKKEVENLVAGGAEKLKDYYENGSKSDENSWIGGVYDAWELICNAPTVETSKIEHKAYNEGFKDGVEQGIRLSESPAGRCKSCKYYHPYYEQLTNIPRGDGYCVIARMTPEGMTTINCNDEFGCSDYEKGGAE